MKILVVDSWPIVADLLRRRNGNVRQSTATAGVAVDFEPSYESAQEHLKDFDRYDAVVIDPYPAEGPSPLGKEIIRQLRGTRVTVIVATASWRIAECVECMQAGASDFIPKTQSPETVVDLILAAIDQAAKRRVPKPDKDAQWVHDHLDELCRNYEGLWIAVEQGACWAAAETYAELLEAVKEMPLNEPRFWRLPSGWVGRYDS
jgi:FixJ family two-component response regulator